MRRSAIEKSSIFATTSETQAFAVTIGPLYWLVFSVDSSSEPSQQERASPHILDVADLEDGF